MQTNPEQWAEDVRYLAKLADWAAGEGFCQIKDMDDPDEWCFDKWNELKPDSNGDDYSADALAAALIASLQAAFAEREARLVGDERQAIINWLRGGAGTDTTTLVKPMRILFLRGLHSYADAIERGDHLAALKDRTHD